MGEKYDVRDRSGRKIGTIEPSDRGSPSGHGYIVLLLIGIILFGVAVTIIAIPYLLFKGGINFVASTIHPVMPHTYFSVKDARIAGVVEYSAGACCFWRYERPDAWNKMQLLPGGSVEFVFKNDYSDGQFSFIPDHGVNTYAGTNVVLILNDNKVSELLWGGGGAFFIPNDPAHGSHSFRELTINLRKGVNTIKIINNDSHGGKLSVNSIHIYDRLCDSFFYSSVCGDGRNYRISP